MSPVRLVWEAVAGDDGVFHVARYDHTVTLAPMHSHDFAELFWVEAGEATHHSGVLSHRIGRGEVVLVAPNDRHGFSRASEDFSMTNLAFPREELLRFRERYFASGGFPWDAAPPRVLRVGPGGLVVPGVLTGAHAPDRLEIDRILLHVLALASPTSESAQLPRWLGLALTEWLRDPAAMGRGVTGLAEVASRSRGHVSRSIRRATGLGATTYLNQLRIDQAAVRLRTTDASILEVAGEVGVLSVSHFYSLFKARFGETPARYRRSHSGSPILDFSPQRK